jgi:hypothetical protein
MDEKAAFSADGDDRPLQRLGTLLTEISQTDFRRPGNRTKDITKLQQAQEFLLQAHFDVSQALETAVSVQRSPWMHLTLLTLTRSRKRIRRLVEILRSI